MVHILDRIAADANRSLGLRLTSSGGFDYVPSAACRPGIAPSTISDNDKHPPILEQAALREVPAKSAAACEALCIAAGHECNAAEFVHPGAHLKLRRPGNATSTSPSLPPVPPSRCILHRGCLERERASWPTRSDVMHRWGPTWPADAVPNSVRWTTNLTLVTVTHSASLSWLRTVPGGLMDLVVYHKHDFGKASKFALTPHDVLAELRESEMCKHAPTLHYPRRSCPMMCSCGRRLARDRPILKYFATVPNYGLTHRKPFGGSREPYGYLQFILDFWDNLPPVVLFTQDDCLARGCSWGMQLPKMRERLRHWQREWGVRPDGSPIPINQNNCMCRVFVEDNFKSRGYFWYRWMSMAQRHLFGVAPENRSTRIVWPQDATFAVSRLILRTQPRWMYESLLRISSVENACMGGTIMWAHAMERLWFELLDPEVAKDLKPSNRNAETQRGACFLGARRK